MQYSGEDTQRALKSNVPILILAGGQGTRLAEETNIRPKPMVEVGGQPLILHIMRYYSHFGFTNFVICAGYLSGHIKDFFSRLNWYDQSLEFHYGDNATMKPYSFINPHTTYHDWRVRVIDTGDRTMTGARIARALEAIQISENGHFGVTYGDGLCNADLSEEFDFHVGSKRIGTVLGVHPRARFGVIEIDSDNTVSSFTEKPQTDRDLINGGFFFFRNSFKKYLSIHGDCVLERDPLENLAKDRQLGMFRHDGFWQCMDTIRDKQLLQEEWDSPTCPWRVWTATNRLHQ
jgi:glucose-1-phosphate cytidylyltransferase